MVTISIAGVLVALAAPPLQVFVTRNAMRALAGDFTLGIQRTRSEAINQNQCVVMCKSSNAHEVQPICDKTLSNWAVGWAVYALPSCDLANLPNDAAKAATQASQLVYSQAGVNTRYTLAVSGTAVRAIMFNGRGTKTLNSAGRFNLSDSLSSTADNNQYGRTLCVDNVGRVRSIAYGYTC